MKAVATALVLIAGAAVVLWYGNTLNSWVLGGLIGGLAALLLSIPISLILFSYLARQREEHERNALKELDIEMAQQIHDNNGRLESVYSYREVPSPGSIYVEEEDTFATERGGWQDEEENGKYLPAPPMRRLPAPAFPPATSNLRPPERRVPVTRRLSRELSERESPRTTRRLAGRSPAAGQSSTMTRSQFQSQALHLARMEAVRQRQEENEIEELPGYRSQRPSMQSHYARERWEREDSRTIRQHEKPQGQTSDFSASDGEVPDTELPYELYKPYPRRTRRIVDASPSPNGPYRALADSERSQREKPFHYEDPETDAIDIGLSTGSLKNPLLRRAPYLYDDDELKSELEQQIDAPITRRTSRKLPQSFDD